MSRRADRRRKRAGFTLIELLVVIGIIAILLSILLPVAAAVRKAAMKADTSAEIGKIQQAIQHYYQDFNAYPGPVPETQIYGYKSAAGSPASIINKSVTSSENLVLGLSGGFDFMPNTTTTQYDPTQIGKGVVSLNALNPRQATTYLDVKPAELSNDSIGGVTSWVKQGLPPSSGLDLIVPEYLDHFPTPRPIIYLRANPGAIGIVDDQPLPNQPLVKISQYYSMEMSPYWVGDTTGTMFPSKKDANSGNRNLYNGPLDFFTSALANTAVNKDSFILISAGYDGFYGTSDDIMYPPLSK